MDRRERQKDGHQVTDKSLATAPANMQQKQQHSDKKQKAKVDAAGLSLGPLQTTNNGQQLGHIWPFLQANIACVRVCMCMCMSMCEYMCLLSNQALKDNKSQQHTQPHDKQRPQKVLMSKTTTTSTTTRMRTTKP